MLHIKHKLSLKLLLVITLSATTVLTVFCATAFAASIPAGCPGSELQGPAAPGVCEAIPPGCPGATRAGPPSPGVSCPYDAPTGAQAGSTNPDPSGSKNLDKNADCKEENLDASNCNIVKHINTLINILSAMVGIVVTIMIIIGGIQYTTAGGDPNNVAKAKKHIYNAILALVMFGLTYAFLQYLIPGGLL